MINLTDIEDVKAIQTNLKASLGTPQGEEVMRWLEEISGWYDLGDTETNIILIKQGKRQVLATIKTLLELTPAQVVAKAQGESNDG